MPAWLQKFGLLVLSTIKLKGVENNLNCYEKRMVRLCHFFARLGRGTAVPLDKEIKQYASHIYLLYSINTCPCQSGLFFEEWINCIATRHLVTGKEMLKILIKILTFN